jgi:diadenosine tetraphosphate (Ap4A) HIT family hydrolase
MLLEVGVMQGNNQCIFCESGNTAGVIAKNRHAYALLDAFPVTELHVLVVPRRHVADYFSLTRQELIACDSLLKQVKEIIQAKDRSVLGFNIGTNVGEVAGQTIFHCHFHLIPRRVNDVSRPEGGIRHVIPGKGYYR